MGHGAFAANVCTDCKLDQHFDGIDHVDLSLSEPSKDGDIFVVVLVPTMPLTFSKSNNIVLLEPLPRGAGSSRTAVLNVVPLCTNYALRAL